MGRNVISVKDFTKENVEEGRAVATRMKELVAKKGGCDVLNVFFRWGSHALASRDGERLLGAFYAHCLLVQRRVLQTWRKGDHDPGGNLFHEEGRDAPGHDALRGVLLGRACAPSS